MPKYIDHHPMGKFSPEQLKGLQNAPKDEFGVTHHDILYNKESDQVYCVLDAPDEEAVKKHHENAGVSCDWVQEVKSTRAA